MIQLHVLSSLDTLSLFCCGNLYVEAYYYLFLGRHMLVSRLPR
jgi:hypothetical protein